MIPARFRYSVLAPTLMLISTNSVNAQQTPLFHAVPGSSAPFSPAVRAGDLIFLSGQIGANPDGTIPPAIADQAHAAMRNLGTALKTAGATFDDVVKCTVMLGDMTKWRDFNAVYVTYFKPGRLPARSAFGANGLALGAGVEVECIAYKPLAAK